MHACHQPSASEKVSEADKFVLLQVLLGKASLAEVKF